MTADDGSDRDSQLFFDSMKQCSVHNVRINRFKREMNRVLIAFYRDIFAVIFNVLKASCLLDSNSELDLFALQICEEIKLGKMSSSEALVSKLAPSVWKTSFSPMYRRRKCNQRIHSATT